MLQSQLTASEVLKQNILANLAERCRSHTEIEPAHKIKGEDGKTTHHKAVIKTTCDETQYKKLVGICQSHDLPESIKGINPGYLKSDELIKKIQNSNLNFNELAEVTKFAQELYGKCHESMIDKSGQLYPNFTFESFDPIMQALIDKLDQLSPKSPQKPIEIALGEPNAPLALKPGQGVNDVLLSAHKTFTQQNNSTNNNLIDNNSQIQEKNNMQSGQQQPQGQLTPTPIVSNQQDIQSPSQKETDNHGTPEQQSKQSKKLPTPNQVQKNQDNFNRAMNKASNKKGEAIQQNNTEQKFTPANREEDRKQQKKELLAELDQISESLNNELRQIESANFYSQQNQQLAGISQNLTSSNLEQDTADQLKAQCDEIKNDINKHLETITNSQKELNKKVKEINEFKVKQNDNASKTMLNNLNQFVEKCEESLNLNKFETIEAGFHQTKMKVNSSINQLDIQLNQAVEEKAKQEFIEQEKAQQLNGAEQELKEGEEPEEEALNIISTTEAQQQSASVPNNEPVVLETTNDGASVMSKEQQPEPTSATELPVPQLTQEQLAKEAAEVGDLINEENERLNKIFEEKAQQKLKESEKPEEKVFGTSETQQQERDQSSGNNSDEPEVKKTGNEELVQEEIEGQLNKDKPENVEEEKQAELEVKVLKDEQVQNNNAPQLSQVNEQPQTLINEQQDELNEIHKLEEQNSEAYHKRIEAEEQQNKQQDPTINPNPVPIRTQQCQLNQELAVNSGSLPESNAVSTEQKQTEVDVEAQLKQSEDEIKKEQAEREELEENERKEQLIHRRISVQNELDGLKYSLTNLKQNNVFNLIQAIEQRDRNIANAKQYCIKELGLSKQNQSTFDNESNEPDLEDLNSIIGRYRQNTDQLFDDVHLSNQQYQNDIDSKLEEIKNILNQLNLNDDTVVDKIEQFFPEFEKDVSKLTNDYTNFLNSYETILNQKAQQITNQTEQHLQTKVQQIKIQNFSRYSSLPVDSRDESSSGSEESSGKESSNESSNEDKKPKVLERSPPVIVTTNNMQGVRQRQVDVQNNPANQGSTNGVGRIQNMTELRDSDEEEVSFEEDIGMPEERKHNTSTSLRNTNNKTAPKPNLFTRAASSASNIGSNITSKLGFGKKTQTPHFDLDAESESSSSEDENSGRDSRRTSPYARINSNPHCFTVGNTMIDSDGSSKDTRDPLPPIASSEQPNAFSKWVSSINFGKNPQSSAAERQQVNTTSQGHSDGGESDSEDVESSTNVIHSVSHTERSSSDQSSEPTGLHTPGDDDRHQPHGTNASPASANPSVMQKPSPTIADFAQFTVLSAFAFYGAYYLMRKYAEKPVINNLIPFLAKYGFNRTIDFVNWQVKGHSPFIAALTASAVFCFYPRQSHVSTIATNVLAGVGVTANAPYELNEHGIVKTGEWNAQNIAPAAVVGATLATSSASAMHDQGFIAGIKHSAKSLVGANRDYEPTHPVARTNAIMNTAHVSFCLSAAFGMKYLLAKYAVPLLNKHGVDFVTQSQANSLPSLLICTGAVWFVTREIDRGIKDLSWNNSYVDRGFYGNYKSTTSIPAEQPKFESYEKLFYTTCAAVAGIAAYKFLDTKAPLILFGGVVVASWIKNNRLHDFENANKKTATNLGLIDFSAQATRAA